MYSLKFKECYVIEGKSKDEDDSKYLPLNFYYNLTVAKDRLGELDCNKNDYRLVFARIERLEVIRVNKG